MNGLHAPRRPGSLTRCAAVPAGWVSARRAGRARPRVPPRSAHPRRARPRSASGTCSSAPVACEARSAVRRRGVHPTSPPPADIELDARPSRRTPARSSTESSKPCGSYPFTTTQRRLLAGEALPDPLRRQAVDLPLHLLRELLQRVAAGDRRVGRQPPLSCPLGRGARSDDQLLHGHGGATLPARGRSRTKSRPECISRIPPAARPRSRPRRLRRAGGAMVLVGTESSSLCPPRRPGRTLHRPSIRGSAHRHQAWPSCAAYEQSHARLVTVG